jgi:hypothetical protein
MSRLQRRTLLALALGAGLTPAMTAVAWAQAGDVDPADPDALARDYAGEWEKVRQDYLAGRVVVRDGWIMSNEEARLLAAR